MSADAAGVESRKWAILCLRPAARGTIAMLKTLREKVDPQWAALLIIDMQNDYLDGEGVLGREGCDLSSCRAAVEPVAKLVASARQARVPVIFIRNWHSAASDSEAWLECSDRRHPGGVRSAEAGSWGAEWYPPLLPEPDDLTFNKARYDAFLKTGLDEALRQRGIRSVIICGTTTNVCVESTARAAHMRDYYLIVPEDGCAAPDRDLHRNSLVNIDSMFGVVVPSAEIRRIWGGE
jgi:ureidoacrylate peracid hydrolase